MKTVSINNYYSTARLESAKNQQISMNSTMSSVFTGLLAIAKNLLFSNKGQIKNLHTTARLSNTPFFIGSEKSYQEKFTSTRKEEGLEATKAGEEIVMPMPYKPIPIRFRPIIKTTQTTYNIMNLFNPFTKNKRIV